MNLQQLRRETDALLADYRFACRQIKEETAALHKASQDAADAAEAQRFLQNVAQQVQRQVHAQIAGVVSRCLSAVFDDPYSFELTFAQRRGKTEADIGFMRNGKEVDPMDASGGGVVDLASFACRLACLSLARPVLRRLLVMDEPFRMLSRNYHERAKELVETLAEELGFQFVIVTHSEDLAAGKVVRL